MLDFSHIDWPDPIKIMQTNWIGRSEGAHVTFHTEQGDPITIYTTRPDTLWGVTFMVLAPEHKLVQKVTTDDRRAEVEAYVNAAASQTEIERTSEDREKTGVFTGGYAINPVNNERIPIWVADYVLITYGSGAIMAVPYGDQRDFEFARKFGLKIVPVVLPEGQTEVPDPDKMEAAYDGPGTMINSGVINGLVHNGEKGRKSPAINAVIDWLEQQGIGKEAVNYRLRDWLISRQRYWGSPIPIIHRQDGTMEAVPDEDLPVKLPENVEFSPTGRSPLTYYEPFLNTVDSDGNPARRETDTMDTFMCSSWYWYRYLSPHYDKGPFDPEEAAYWLPVDVYTGGAEHATMHLLYSRWFTKAMRDLGMFDETIEIMNEHGRDTDLLMWGEPMLLLRNQGQVLGAERKGDMIIASGRKVGENKIIADSVKVVDNSTSASGQGESFYGELVRRTENLLTLQSPTGDTMIVEVPESAVIEIPGIEGPNSVNQLKHHLEVQRMSKSKGNVVNPDELVQQYGTDTVRAYLMFGFDWQKGGPWNPQQISGVVRWLNDVWDIVLEKNPNGQGDAQAERDLERKVHQAIAKVSESLERFSFNTAISGLMTLRNDLQAVASAGKVSATAWQEALRTMLLLMAPFTPHIAEELWSRIGGEYSIHNQAWPEYDPEKAKEDTVSLVIMINGKPRGEAQVAVDISQQEAEQIALASEAAQRYLNGGTPKKVIFIPGRAGQEPKINIVL